MDGLLLQTVEGLGDAPLVRTGCEIWEWLQGEKEEVTHEILSEGAQLETRLRELNDAQDRLMNGAYGRCTDCGGEIDSGRLAADPASALCMNCQRSTEPEAVFYTM